MRAETVLTGIEPGRLARRDAAGEPLELPAAGVVLVTQRVSHDALFHELDGLREAVFRIGDCVAPRLLAEAIFDGHRLAREIDGADPEVACPTCASASATATSCRRPRSRPRWPFSHRARNPRGAPASSSTTRPPRPRASTRCCAPPGRTGSWPWARAPARRSIAGGAWPSATARVSPSRARRSRPAARSAPSSSAHPARPSHPAPTSRSASRAHCPHLVGMAGSETVVAVNRDRGARIFEYADLGVATDAGGLIDALLALGERP